MNDSSKYKKGHPESWKTIDCNRYYFPDYEVSTYGRIKSNKRPNNKGYIMKQYKNRNGYYYIWLTKKGVQYRVYIHRIMGSVFDRQKNQHTPLVHHRDGIKSNNFVWNLKWTSHKENNWRNQIKLLASNRKLETAPF